jgi:hypothetical protein
MSVNTITLLYYHLTYPLDELHRHTVYVCVYVIKVINDTLFTLIQTMMLSNMNRYDYSKLYYT